MKRFKFFILKTLLISIFAMVLGLIPVLQIMNFSAYDQKFRLRGPMSPGNDIVLVTIDNESIDWLSKWPWPRKFYATAVDQLKAAGAKLIVFDVFFDSPTQFDPEDDDHFAQSVAAAGNVIFASRFQEMQSNQMFKVVQLPYKKPIKKLYEASLDIGIVHPYKDLDNVVRRFQILYKTGKNYYPSLALQVVKYFRDAKEWTVDKRNDLRVKNARIPLVGGKLRISYYGPRQTFLTVPFSRIYDGSELVDHPELVKDKIVLIGASAYELHDVFPTPFDINLPGVEIHANVIQTMLDQYYISNLPALLLFGMICLIVAFTLFMGRRLNLKVFFLLILAETGAYIGLNFYCFIKRLCEVPLYQPILAIIIAFVAEVIAKFIREEREKRQVRGMFSQYVAPSVVNELMANPDKLNLGGEMKEVSIFFSDIRAFTTFSENRTPQEVVDMLNEYLDVMTETIFEFGGTLDKYVGDEIMAVFGAPLATTDHHAKTAVACCIAQMKKLRELHKKWMEEGKPLLDIGMGVNTGEVIVGNIGSRRHKDYTVIGDAVNLAARLEALTRNYSDDKHTCYLLISEATYNLVKDDFDCKYLDDIAVKGKKQKTKVYEVNVA